MTNLVVSTLEDENDGDFNEGDLSLREAIALSNNREGADTIAFAESLNDGTIVLDNSLGRDLDINDSVSIIGLGRDNLTFDGSFVFNVAADTNVNLDGLNFTGTTIDNSGNLTFSRSSISQTQPLTNTPENSAIISRGTIEIVDSAIEDNDGVISSGTVNITNSTIVNNSGGMGVGGIDNFGDGIATVTSSIVANNGGGFGTGDVSDGGEFISGGNNLIGNGDNAEGFVDGIDGDLVGTADNLLDPQLGELQDNGGITQTIALLDGSPAIDAGSNPNNLAFDQRGEGFERTVGDGTDIGAYEVQDSGGGEIPTELVVSTLEDEDDGDYSAGDLSLREAIALANEREGSDTITFDASLSGGTITSDSSQERELTIDDSVSIVGLGQDNLTLDGGFIFNVAETDIDVAIDGLNITGGTIDSSGNLTFSNSTISETLNIAGSSDYYAIISRGTAKISDSTIKDNSGGSSVGIVIESGTATIEGSTIANNDSLAYAQAGVIIRSDAKVDISNSTIANNRARSNAGIDNAGTVNITNSTIANNTGGLGRGGIDNFSTDGIVTVTSSIIANNTGYRGTGDVSGDGKFVSGGNNLISNGDDATGFVNGVNGDIVGTNGDDPENPQNDGLINPQLGELQNNGGSTETLALLEGSPAIDAGSNPNNLTTDQRGEGFNRTVGNGTDIGAYEVQTTGNGQEIIGTDKNDFLLGGSGNDTINGLDRSDFIQGLDGDDLLSGGNGNDFVDGSNGNDSVNGDADNDFLQGGNGDDVLRGGDGNDRIFGGGGSDTIDDGAGNDIMFGGAGSDRFVNSNSGNDLLTGGSDGDFFIFNLNPGAGFFDRDRILDFQAGTDAIGFRPVVDDPQSFDNFDDLDTDASGILDELDERVRIIGGSTVIDFSDLFERSQDSDTITLVGATNLSSDDFLFATTI